MEDLLDAPTRAFPRTSGVENSDLDKAITEYNEAIEEAIKDVAIPIKRELEAARRQGKLEVAKRYEEAQRAIEKRLLMPRLHDLSKGARNNFEKAIRRATQQGSAAYEKAIKDYTRKGDNKTADTVTREHYEFLEHPSHRPLHVPTDAIGFRGHWYLFSRESLPLEPTLAAAQKFEGYLLTIDDTEENEFIKPLVQNDVRLGLFRIGVEWMKHSRRPATFFFWDGGQPNNRENETCAGIRVDGKWHDYFPSDSLLYCIEWE
jgi:hypothetical protein